MNIVFKLIKMYYVILLPFSFVMANNYQRRVATSSSLGDFTQKATGTFRQVKNMAKGYGYRGLFFIQMFFSCIFFGGNGEYCAHRYITFPIIFFFLSCCVVSFIPGYLGRAAKKQQKMARTEQKGGQLLQMPQNNYLTEMNDVKHMQPQMFQGQLQQSQKEEESENSSNSEHSFCNSESLYLGYNTVPD